MSLLLTLDCRVVQERGREQMTATLLALSTDPAPPELQEIVPGAPHQRTTYVHLSIFQMSWEFVLWALLFQKFNA